MLLSTAIVLLVAALLLRGKGLITKWYDWVIGAIATLMLFFSIQNYFGSLNEFESDAAPWFLLIVGLPALMLFIVDGVLIVRRSRTATA